MDCRSSGSFVREIFPGKNTGVGCHAHLQGIFLTQRSNPHLLCLLHCRWILYERATREVSIIICKCLDCCSVAQSCPTLRPHELQHERLPCPSLSSRICPGSRSLHRWCHPAISSSDALFSICPQSFPASGTFPVSHLFLSDDQSIGGSVSASVLPMNIQGWSPLRLTGLISLLAKGLWGVFSSITVRRHQFFGVLPSLEYSSHNRTWPLGRP